MNRSTLVSRAAAVAEVCLAFAVMHVAFRWFKRYTAWGQFETETGMNFSPGVAMMLVGVGAILLRRRRPADAGLTVRPFFASLNAALVCLLILLACGAVLLRWIDDLRPPSLGAGGAGVLALGGVGASLLMLWVLRRFGGAVERTPRLVPVAVLTGVGLLPVGLALAQWRGAGWEALTTLWVLAGAGIGEEVFFRGYVQSRLHEAFGRPWTLLGVRFGAGLFGASALFSIVHVLNTADYFTGVYRFHWWHGLATVGTLYYGFLRERTGSVLAPGVVHGYVDLLSRLPRLLAGG